MENKNGELITGVDDKWEGLLNEALKNFDAKEFLKLPSSAIEIQTYMIMMSK